MLPVQPLASVPTHLVLSPAPHQPTPPHPATITVNHAPPPGLLQAEHKTSGPVPDHLRARGYVLDQDEAPKTKIENPFDLLNLADD